MARPSRSPVHKLLARAWGAGVLILAGCMSHLTVYQVPSPVLRAFKAAYPTATEVEFREQVRQGVKLYTAEFMEDGFPHEVDYTFDGKPYAPLKRPAAAEAESEPAGAGDDKKETPEPQPHGD